VGVGLTGREETEVLKVGKWWWLMPVGTLLEWTWLRIRSRCGRLGSYLGVVQTEAEAVTRERELWREVGVGVDGRVVARYAGRLR